MPAQPDRHAGKQYRHGGARGIARAAAIIGPANERGHGACNDENPDEPDSGLLEVGDKREEHGERHQASALTRRPAKQAFVTQCERGREGHKGRDLGERREHPMPVDRDIEDCRQQSERDTEAEQLPARQGPETKRSQREAGQHHQAKDVEHRTGIIHHAARQAPNCG